MQGVAEPFSHPAPTIHPILQQIIAHQLHTMTQVI